MTEAASTVTSRVSSAGYAGATGFSGSAAAGDRWGVSAGEPEGALALSVAKPAVAPPDVY